MEIASKYDPRAVEEKWYNFWLEKKLFHSEPDRRVPYTIVIPPPNVTGVLHMGHMLNNTIQDVLIRRARMMGKNACWVPGTDHASIATEAKVVKALSEQGIKKHDLTRDQFLEHAWEWTHKHGGIILQQLRKLGASCDWDRTAFTMDDTRSESVTKVFVDLYNKGLIYRGLRMINWDPKALTALSTEEVEYKEERSKLYYLKYYLADLDNLDNLESLEAEGNIIHKDNKGFYAVVATTRPETIMGDTAMCINPKDSKNQWLRGHRVIVPLVGREVRVIEDRYVDIEFGTGCLKVTPAHDVNDYNLGRTHNLETIDIFNDNGTISEQSPLYVGMDRFACRKQIAKDLEAAGLMEKVEDYTNKVGYSQRNPDTAIEPRLSLQWFLKMQHFADIALPPVMNGEIKFYPEKYKNTYRQWLENIQDWCISRQLWWGHRIPAWYLEVDGKEEIVVAVNEEEARKIAKEKYNYTGEMHQDEDALDTWFSSWLWPISLFDGINNPGNEEINYYYPTVDLITAPDIIFFWVARMIMAGEEYLHAVPFRNVYFTGVVRDKLGRKMSKSLGNSPDPIKLMEEYGADGVRMGMLLTAPAGNDILFDEKICEQGRNFSNKMWNALRLIMGWKVETDQQPTANSQQPTNEVAVEWMEQRMAQVLEQIEKDFDQYRLSEALMATYKLAWDDFCSWYLEMVKPAYGSPIDRETYDATISIFTRLMLMLHPFMPFVTEEIWHALQTIGKEDDKAAFINENYSIMNQRMPTSVFYDQRTIDDCDIAREMIAGVRNLRNSRGLSPKEALEMFVVCGEGKQPNKRFDGIICKLANVSKIEYVENKVEGAISFMVGTTECFVPLKENIDVEAERKKLEDELRYAEGFLASVMKKLGNEKFVNGAPEKVVAVERQKKADAEQKIAALKSQLENLH
ncbi:MAG: valine--tRNA ligase [Bacteroidales bacterium]|nr:valine--tRNA ligase [Bacteroidales bacterium]